MNSLAERFWSKVEKGDGCWLWKASVNKAGYGSFGVPGNRGARAHRVAYELVNGPVLVGLEVCHRCDTKACVNPAHLFLGSHQDNMTDMANKDRATNRKGSNHPQAKLTDAQVEEIRSRRALGERLAPLAREFGIGITHVSELARGKVRGLTSTDGVAAFSIARGERLPQATLTEVQVLEIRSRAANGEPQSRIGAAYGVRQSTISKIVRRERWAHI